MTKGHQHSIAEPHVGCHLQPDEPVTSWRFVCVQYLAWIKELNPETGFVIALVSDPESYPWAPGIETRATRDVVKILHRYIRNLQQLHMLTMGLNTITPLTP